MFNITAAAQPSLLDCFRIHIDFLTRCLATEQVLTNKNDFIKNRYFQENILF